jgi:hypothetical protein
MAEQHAPPNRQNVLARLGVLHRPMLMRDFLNGNADDDENKNNEDNETPTCAVCWDDELMKEDPLGVTSCGHVFHCACFERWSKERHWYQKIGQDGALPEYKKKVTTCPACNTGIFTSYFCHIYGTTFHPKIVVPWQKKALDTTIHSLIKSEETVKDLREELKITKQTLHRGGAWWCFVAGMILGISILEAQQYRILDGIQKWCNVVLIEAQQYRILHGIQKWCNVMTAVMGIGMLGVAIALEESS